MKKFSLAFMMLLLCLSSTIAQRTITGTITDNENEALIGASVLIKGTTIGTVTDFDGAYSLSIPDGEQILVVSYTGFATQEVKTGTSNVLNLILSEGLELSEVVVTGLGIKREKKALGYAVTTIGSGDVNLKPESDVGRILRGKVPGVNITSTSGLAGSGTNVIIRGYSSITGDNQPLFVVDGVPFNADTNSDRDFSSGGATASSRFLDLDPNSIAEISILKGLSATVLYGEAGRNGVVLVTTKGGSVGNLDKKMEVTVNQSIFVTEVSGIPETQKNYGNGWQNDASNAFSNWGAPFNNTPEFQTHINGITNGGRYELGEDGNITHPYSFTNFADVFPDIKDSRIPWVAKDALAEFLGGTGLVNNTSFNIANKLAGGTSINFNYGYLNDEGFIPGNNLERHNFGLGLGSQLSNGLDLRATFNYTKSVRNTPPASPIFSSNPIDGASIFSNVLYTPVSHDLYGWPNTNPLDNSSVFYRSNNGIQHPLWTLDNIKDNEKVDRFFGNINLGYKLTDFLKATYRVGVDGYTQTQRYTINKGGAQVPDGALSTSERRNLIIDQTANLVYNTNLSVDWNLDGILGINLRREDRDEVFALSTEQFVFNLLTHENFIQHSNFSGNRIENTVGAYGTLSAGFKDFLYLNFQGRNDWTSTLERDNRSIFYPSGSISFIPTDAFPEMRNNQVINYLKLRLGYGTSAGYPSPYQTRNVLGTETRSFITRGGTVLNTNTVDNRFGNPDLEPERHTELELGIEGKFLQRRVGLDLSLYRKESQDLIIDLELDPSTGFSQSTINSAKMENNGVEVSLNLIPIVTENAQWSLTGNFTKNVSEIISIADGIDKVLISGFNFLGNFAIPGEPYGVIEGSRILRNDAGVPIIGSTGTYQQNPEQGIIGDPNPDFIFNVISNFNWKGLSFRFQFDWQQGGDIWGSTASTLTARGIAGETGFNRFVPVIVSGVKADNTPNDIQITTNRHYWEDTGVFYDENRIFDATTVRLREVSLSYSLPSSVLDNTPFGSASLTLSGQNLWYEAVNFPSSINFDPEVLSLGVGNGQGFDFVTGPTSKRYGASLSFTF